MRLILLQVCLLFGLTTLAQSPLTKVVPRSPKTATVEDASIYAKYNLGVPRYIDTTAALLFKGADSCGTIIFTYPNNIWKRSCSPKRWEKISSDTSNVHSIVDDALNSSSITLRNAKSNGLDQSDTTMWIRNGNEIVQKRLIKSTGILFSTTDSSITISVDSSKYNTKRYSDSALATKASSVGSVSKVLANNVQISNTGNTTVNTIFTGTIPANSIGVNGSFHIIWLISGNGTNTKNYYVRLNGVQIATVSTTTNTTAREYTVINNRNSLSAQISSNSSSASNNSFNGQTSGAPTTYTLDTSLPITITVQAQSTVGSETASLESLEVLAVF